MVRKLIFDRLTDKFATTELIYEGVDTYPEAITISMRLHGKNPKWEQRYFDLKFDWDKDFFEFYERLTFAVREKAEYLHKQSADARTRETEYITLLEKRAESGEEDE